MFRCCALVLLGGSPWDQDRNGSSSGGWKLGKKMRSNIGYYERLLLRAYPSAETRLTEAEELDQSMTDLFELHQTFD